VISSSLEKLIAIWLLYSVALDTRQGFAILADNRINSVLITSDDAGNISAAKTSVSTRSVQESTDIQHQFMILCFRSIIEQPIVFGLV
jgi:hypothetical protein